MNANEVQVPLTKEQERVAMSSPAHLKTWLQNTGRDYIVFRADDLIDSLSWPKGVQVFMQIIDAYRAHRREQPSEVPHHGKTDVLEPSEIDRAIEHLQRLKSDLLESRK